MVDGPSNNIKISFLVLNLFIKVFKCMGRIGKKYRIEKNVGINTLTIGLGKY